MEIDRRRFSERRQRRRQHFASRGNVTPAYARPLVAIDPVRRTALSLTCAAKAHVPKPRGAAAAAHTAGQQRTICSRRDTALVLFGPGASAPDRSRAATGSAMSWAAVR